MMYLFLSVFSAFVVLLDQLTKYLTVLYVKPAGSVDFIPGILGFTYAENTGGPWSILSDHTWILILVSLVFFALIFFAVGKKWFTGTGVLWSLFAIIGGGIGNLIDRVRLGYVVDMLQTKFMDFPVFNVADCFITCGAVSLAVFFLLDELKNRKKPGEETT